MNIDDLINHIENEFEELNVGTLKSSSSIKDIDGWSSMHALILIALVDSQYDILLTGEELRSIMTVQDLFDTILSRKNSDG
jgi:acyl carrier protein